MKNTLDADGQLQQVQSRRNTDASLRNYAKAFNYTAAGAVSAMRLGNGLWETTQFNSRLQPTQIGLGGSASNTSLLKLNYDYGTTANNGNVLSQTITVPSVGQTTGFVATQTYSYDSLNRLKLASENITPNGGSQSQSWQQTYTFDRYGNRNFDEVNTTTIPKNCGTPPNQTVCPADVPIYNPSVNSANNRLNGYTFDASGNTTVDAEGRQFTYDAENKQVYVKNSQNQTIGEYFYNGDGQRIKKIVPSTGETTIFVYDASNKLVAEYSTIVEPQSTAEISYLTNDYLGSPRITTDAVGQVISRRDFLPFGEEINASTSGRTTAQGYGGADSIRQKFTGYERDAETSLDYAKARMFGYSHGRFTSPDPLLTSGRPTAPQTWNRYVYALNNPLVYIDPTGLWEWSEALGGSATDKELEKQRDKAKKDKNDTAYQRLDGIVTKRKAFIDGLAKAKTEAEKITDKNERATVKATLAMYGKPQDGNDVTVAERDPSSGSGAAFTKFEDGRYIVAFAASEFSADSLYISIAHESYHMGNIFFDRVFMAMGATGYTTTVHDTEEGAYRVSSLMAQASGVGTLTLNSQNGGTILWDSAWSKLDAKVMEANRSAAIETHLSNLGIGENDQRGKNTAFPGGGKWR